MARIHGRWAHYVRPGLTDPNMFGASFFYQEPDDEKSPKKTTNRKVSKKSSARKAKAERRKARQRANRAKGAAESFAQPSQNHGPSSTPRNQTARSLRVVDIDGNTIYSCGSKKGPFIRAFLMDALAADSLDVSSPTVITLKKTVFELGFFSKKDFVYWCSNKGERRNPFL